jgi:hypothetical protein
MGAPDFLCFGTTRSGTTFLYTQLRDHPQVWLPPEKELHYFSFQRGGGFANRKHLKHLRKLVPMAVQAARGKRGVVAELAWQARYMFGPRNDEWFLSLFPTASGFVTGHIEPTYAVVDAETVDAIRDLMPDTKLLYLMRDPIGRAWSSVTKSTAKNRDRPMDEVPEVDIQEKLDRSAIRMSSYIDHIETWEKSFPGDRFFFGFFEDMVREPEAFLGRVCRFIGIDPPPHLDVERVRRPVNDTRDFKVDIPPEVERSMAEQLIGPTRRLHERFGGHASDWYRRMQRVLEPARSKAPQDGRPT